MPKRKLISNLGIELRTTEQGIVISGIDFLYHFKSLKDLKLV